VIACTDSTVWEANMSIFTQYSEDLADLLEI